MTPYYGLAYELTARCDQRSAEEVKAICDKIDPALRRAALHFFFTSKQWKRHRRLRRRIAELWDRSRQQIGSPASKLAGGQAASLHDRIGTSLDAATEELAERFREAAG